MKLPQSVSLVFRGTPGIRTGLESIATATVRSNIDATSGLQLHGVSAYPSSPETWTDGIVRMVELEPASTPPWNTVIGPHCGKTLPIQTLAAILPRNSILITELAIYPALP